MQSYYSKTIEALAIVLAKKARIQEMEKVKHKDICDHCKGNGYLRESNGSYTEVHQCPTCNSQGEVVARSYMNN